MSVIRFLSGSFYVVALGMLTALAPAAHAQELAITPYRDSGTYGVGERVGWIIAPADRSTARGRYRYLIKRDGLTPVDSGTLDLSGGTAVIETSLSEPGMVLVEVRRADGSQALHGRSRAEIGRVLLGAAVAPRDIEPASPRPLDFDTFWTAKLDALEAVAAEPVVTPGESDRPGVEYFTIKMNNVDGAHVYGQLARPAHVEKAPALLILQWASPPYPLHKEWVTERAAQGWLVLNVEPHDVPGDMPQAFYEALPQRIKDYATIGRHSRDESYFLSMYLGDYRAVEYLASRPDWDGRTLVVMGTSMGGQQSLALAGLHPKVTALIAHVPSGCDVTGPLFGRAAPYPQWDVADADVLSTAVYFDPANFATRINARALISVGFIDETSTPAGIWSTFNAIPGPKEAVPMVDAPHSHLATSEQQAPFLRRAAEWLDDLVHGRDPRVPSRPPD